MRHGEPEIPRLSLKIKSNEFQNCLEIYRYCGILNTSVPDKFAMDNLDQFNTVVSSDLKRSVDSALLFCSDDTLIRDQMFREIEDDFFTIPLIKLTPRTWGNIFILLWLLGAFECKKAFQQGKKRAKICAKKLVRLAEKNEKVLFVGHGFINTYIAKELKRLGWKGPKIPGKTYWDYSVYRKNL